MKRIFNMLKKYRKELIFPIAALLITIAVDSLNPFLVRMIIDKALPSKDKELFFMIIGGLLMVTLAKSGFGYYKEYSFDMISLKVYRDLKKMLFNHIESLHFSYFDNMNTGELMSRMNEDTENVWRSLSFGFRLMAEQFIYFIIGVVVLGTINLKLTLIILLIMAPIAPIALKFEEKIGQNYEEISDHTALLNTTAQENIAGVRLVKAFAREKFEIAKFFDKNRRNFELNNEQAKITSDHFPVIEMLTNLAIIVMIWIGALFVIRGEMTVGDIALFSGFVWNLIWPLRELGWVMSMAAQFKASAIKISDIMDTEALIADKENARDFKIEGNVEFKDVSFSYTGEETLTDISFKALSGKSVAIMGTTGSGKSSIISLIGRYYEQNKGQILIDGTDNRDIRLETLRNAISIVFQDTFLFSESIRNNISFGDETIGEDKINNAIKTACADFVYDLEDGLETVIGERGVGLSGGQKQRISIARALVKETPILVLDDATSALDMETEYELLKNLKTQMGRKTVFIIAHRISAVKNADLIIYLENGKIAEMGNHHELLEKKGHYYDIYTEQYKDFDALSEVI